MTTKSEVDSTKEVILIDLDVLLDTRLAALIATDIDWTNAVLDDGSYHNRDTDVWNNIVAFFVANHKTKLRNDCRFGVLIFDLKFSIKPICYKE